MNLDTHTHVVYRCMKTGLDTVVATLCAPSVHILSIATIYVQAYNVSIHPSLLCGTFVAAMVSVEYIPIDNLSPVNHRVTYKFGFMPSAVLGQWAFQFCGEILLQCITRQSQS